MATLFDNPIVTYFIVIGILGFIGAYFYKNFIKKEIPTFKEFKPQHFKDTTYDDLMKKVKNQGLKLKEGKLIIGVHVIARIHRWLRVQGESTPYHYDDNKKEFVIDEKDKPEKYDFLIFLCRSKNILYRLLGIKQYFFILKKESFLRFDDISNSFILEDGTDLISYGDLWLNSQGAVEYLHDISTRRMNIELMSALENYPNKIVHLEMQQAKKERLYREIMETDKAKYEAIKKAEEKEAVT